MHLYCFMSQGGPVTTQSICWERVSMKTTLLTLVFGCLVSASIYLVVQSNTKPATQEPEPITLTARSVEVEF